MPVVSIAPAAAAFAVASSSAGQSAAVQPLRDSPVSILRCTRAALPSSAAVATTRSRAWPEDTETSTPAASAARSDSVSRGVHSQASTGSVMPAARSASASSSIATPSQLAPPASAARAEATMPWPYPSALTTAISSAAVLDFRVATLAAMAARSTTASVCGMAPVCQTGAPASMLRRARPAARGARLQPADLGRSAAIRSPATTGPAAAARCPAAACR